MTEYWFSTLFGRNQWLIEKGQTRKHTHGHVNSMTDPAYGTSQWKHAFCYKPPLISSKYKQINTPCMTKYLNIHCEHSCKIFVLSAWWKNYYLIYICWCCIIHLPKNTWKFYKIVYKASAKEYNRVMLVHWWLLLSLNTYLSFVIVTQTPRFTFKGFKTKKNINVYSFSLCNSFLTHWEAPMATLNIVMPVFEMILHIFEHVLDCFWTLINLKKSSTRT